MEIWHNPRCTKSRQTLAFLTENNISPEVREYLKNPPTKEELESVISKLGITPDMLIRKTEAIYKENFKGKSLTSLQWLEAMIEYPKLIERPIVISGEKAVIGRPPENVLEII